jgi:hypothetical protein
MIKYQLIYNGNEAFPLVNTKEKAESFKRKAEAQFPGMRVEIKVIECEGVKQ